MMKSRPFVQCLRVYWVVITLWCELIVFYSSVRLCTWPDSALSSPTHLLLVADPQILDHRSYPNRSPILTYFTQLIVDLNIRKSWKAALRTRPDIIVFLGDMMDGARFVTSDVEYEKYYHRFRNIFSTRSQIPVQFIPGNHDIGLQDLTSISGPARRRYKSHFGPLNSYLSISNHTIVFLDAPSLVEEDFERVSNGRLYSEWHGTAGGSVEFIKVVAKGKMEDPVILFSHIPLYRDAENCGPVREKGTIRAGGGVGYQNMLGKDVTTFLLQTLRPSIAFSGDDHDYCVHYHPTAAHGGIYPIREVSVKSMSISMGIRRPGFQLLSLDPWDGRSDRAQQRQADMPCFLPDQLGIYLSVYIPSLLVSILAVFAANACRLKVTLNTRQPIQRTSSPQRATQTVSSLHQVKDLEFAEDSTGSTSVLPYPVSILAGGHRYPSLLRQFGARAYSLFPVSTSPQPGSRRQRRTSFLGGSLLDIWAIAVFPLGVFAVISIYVTFV
ncbi:Metallo-dependent phosphatase-like protein [Collybia nuda]|uniref:Metallo-dependent phosphatase-like protein n=1 Tax=Collybia nuda TaxID=64659 RepID=A0A9P5YJV8_9AGAR|nr:Metallo-dependent phosphatase-like protein [Collybia nuda]